MDPLSPWTYARRNKRKILPTLIILTFVVMLVVTLLTTLRGLKESMLLYTREFDHWTGIFPKRDTRLSEETRKTIVLHPAVERVIDSRNCFVRVRALIAWIPYQLRAVKRDEMFFLMERCGARLKEGTLPAAGTSEVALHENLVKANGWSLGTEFGMDVVDDDWMPGRFKVVGILDGPAPLGFASFEYINNPLLYAYSAKLWQRLLVIPRPGRLAELNAWLRTQSEIKTWDKARSVQEVSEAFDRILLILNFISVLLIVVVSVVVGLIQNIFFGQRMDEFALLLAIGHAKRRLVRKVMLETAGIMTFSWATGVGLALLVLAAFRELLLAPRGIPLPLFQAEAFFVSLALPAVAQVFAGATVMGRLRRLDPIAIIERRG